MEPIIVIHGGAGSVSTTTAQQKLEGTYRAADVGSSVLLDGGSALDAVVAAIHVLDDDEVFNSGRGSVLNIHGEAEMDAMIMDGTKLKAGAVGAIKHVKHPIDVACLVMQKTDHVLIVGPEANAFAKKQNVPIMPAYKFVTKRSINALEDHIKGIPRLSNEVGTVGAVALDQHGNVASATSTGGMTGKLPGRIGDTPLVGCGGYADNNIGAISATGHGESITRVCLSHRIMLSIANGMAPKQASREALEYMGTVTGEKAGIILVTPKGEIVIEFSSQHMAWSYKKGSHEIRVGYDNCPDI